MLDYDRLAREYSRHRKLHPEVLSQLVENGAVDHTCMVLEVGCGTGNYIAAIEEATGASCWGIDPSAEMLTSAREKSITIDYQVGRAEDLSGVPAGFFDLVFSVDVIHHVVDRSQYISEAYRVLKPGGWLCTVTDSEWVIRHRIPLTRYFPETVEQELRRYAPISQLKEWMKRAGFDSSFERTVEFAYDLEDISAFRDRVFSSLHLIPEDAFQRGLRRMEEDLAQGPIHCVSRYTMVWGSKAGQRQRRT